MNRNALIVAAILLLLTSSLSAPDALAGCRKCLVKSYVKALNAGDLDGVASSFADRVAIGGSGSAQTLDRAALRDLLAWEIAAGVSITVEEYEWEDDVVRAVFTEHSRLYDLLGIEAHRYRATFVFEGDLIAGVRLETIGDGAALNAALAPLSQWIALRRDAVPAGS